MIGVCLEAYECTQREEWVQLAFLITIYNLRGLTGKNLDHAKPGSQ